MIFWKILLAHALTDFVFQPDSLAENKGKITVLLVYTLIFFVVSVVILLPDLSYQTVTALVCLAVFHGFIDYLKNRVQKGTAKTHWIFFLVVKMNLAPLASRFA